ASCDPDKIMTPEQWKEVGPIFNAAAALRPEERSSFLDHACGQNEVLRHEVESLLSLEWETGGFLSSPALTHAATMFGKAEPRLSAGKRLGNYEVLEFVESGGMGEVYKARNVTLGNVVALKFLPTALAEDANRLRRLKQEARAASSLNHPNIITIHDF